MDKTSKEETIALLTMAFKKIDASGDETLNKAKQKIKHALADIDAPSARKLVATVGAPQHKPKFSTTPPKIKGRGLGKQTSRAAGTDKENNLAVPKIKQNKTAKFGTKPPSIKNKVKEENNDQSNEKEGDDQEPIEEEINDLNPVETTEEEKDNDKDLGTLELTDEQIVKIEKHPQGGLVGNLAKMSVSQIAEAYNPEQLKAICDQLGVEVHHSVKNGETFARYILTHINDNIINEGDNS